MSDAQTAAARPVAAPGSAYRAGRYAAIDIGTVTCRMLVADVDAQGRITPLDREYAITNLGEGTDETRLLRPEAIERVARTVEGYVGVLDRLQPPGGRIAVRAIATSASRDARNAADFARRMAETGVVPQVIPGTREAALSFRGASSEFAGSIVVADVGGGSTEVVAGTAGADPVCARSFDIGCRRATERLLASDPPTAAELGALRAWVRETLAPYFDDLRLQGLLEGRLIAVAGTATSVVAVRDALEVYDSARVHKARVSREDLAGVLGRLAAEPLEERRRTVGLDPGRAPVIVAGLVILEQLLDLGGFSEFTVSESDILQGVVLEQAAAGA